MSHEDWYHPEYGFSITRSPVMHQPPIHAGL